MMLGNLTVQQIERRLGINFPDDIRKFMKKSHQSNAQIIKKNKLIVINHIRKPKIVTINKKH